MTTMSFHSGYWASSSVNFRTLPVRKAATAASAGHKLLGQHLADALRSTGHFALALVPFALLAWMFVAG